MARGDLYLRIVCMAVLWTVSYGQLRDYIMENSCSFAGILDVPENTNIYINGGGGSAPKPVLQPCLMRFRASKEDYILSVEVTTMEFIDCNVEVKIITTSTQTLKCGMSNPGKRFLNQRSVEITLSKSPEVFNYKFQLIITSSRKVIDPGVQDTQPMAVGLVVGIVGGVFLFLIILAVVGVCCYKHTRKLRYYHDYAVGDEHKSKLEEREPSNVSVGITNSSASTNYDSSPRAKTKLLHENDYGKDARNDRPRVLAIPNQQKKPPPPPEIVNFVGSPKKSTNSFDFDKEDNDPYDKLEDHKPKPQKSPFLDALHKNPKFRSTYNSTEKDAEERRKRISSSSLSQQGVNASDASLDSAATPPKLPSVPAVPKSPNNKKKHASIKGRVPRPVSSSEEELGQNVRTSDESVEDMAVTPVKKKAVSEQQQTVSVLNPKADTRHTLKPDRKKSSKTNSKDKKLSDLPDPIQRIGNFEKNQSIRSSRSSKRSNKSPRLGARGLGHRRNRGDDTDGSRPGTPTSVMDRDDLESLPPLERSASRQSLYASRSSLYKRRGRSRQNSFTESVASSYAHDDMEVCRHSRSYSRDRYDYSEDEFDGYERPINRHEKYKMFKSEGDIVHEAREKSTQTLRETATQTGHEQPVILHPERVVKRKRRSKSLSAAGTQTAAAKESKAKSENGKARSKSTSSEKPKPKPKPKPRKSTDGDLDEKKKKSSAENLADNNNKADINNVESYPDSAAINNQQVQGVPAYSQPGVVQPPYLQHGVPPSAIPPHMMQPGMMPYNMVPQGQPGVPVVGVPGSVYPGNTMPYGGAPPQAYGIQPPPYQPANVPGKPKKSNWELLCEMTEKGQNGPPSETGSLPNSVFVSNPPSNFGDARLAQPPNVAYYQPQSAQMLPMTINPSVGVPSGLPSLGGGSHGHRSGPPSLPGSDPGPSLENGPVQQQPMNLPKKSSWEALKDITDDQYKITYGAQSESMV